jgi:hypothetical protein
MIFGVLQEPLSCAILMSDNGISVLLLVVHATDLVK